MRCEQKALVVEASLYPMGRGALPSFKFISSLFHACVMGPESGRDGACINGGTVIKESGEVF